MNDKIKIDIIMLALVIGCTAIGIYTGYNFGKGTANTRIKEIESKLSDVQTINTELQTANSKHIATIQRLQGLTESSTRSIQLLESGIAKLKGIGEAKDIRIVEAERRVRDLSEEIGRLESKIDIDSERITRILEKFRSTNKGNLDRVNSNSSVMWSNNTAHYYKIAEEYKWHLGM
jgi:chromosome segregation ATPase